MLHQTCLIVGAHFRPPAKAILQVLPQGTPLILRPEPENPYDDHAVAVDLDPGEIPISVHEELNTLAGGMGHSIESILDMDQIHLGYIPRELALTLHTPIKDAPKVEAKLTFNAQGKPSVAFTLNN